MLIAHYKMSGFVGNLDGHQQQTLERVKQKLEKELDNDLKEYYRVHLNDDSLILRFLRARKFDTQHSYDMLCNMLKFRKDFQNMGVGALHVGMCENELKTGKSFFHNYDREGRPVCYVRAAYHDPSYSDPFENQRYCVLMMEYGKKILTPPNETVTLVFDMSNVSVKNLDLKSMQFMVSTLQNFYPESLGKVLVYNSTWIVNGIWKIIRPWLDSVTAAKVAFIKQEEFSKYIPLENLPKDYGGKDPFVYNYTSYRSKFAEALRPSA